MFLERVYGCQAEEATRSNRCLDWRCSRP